MGTGHMVTGAEGQLTLLPLCTVLAPCCDSRSTARGRRSRAFSLCTCIETVQAWEAATLSFALIPLLSDPANYYYGFVVCGALLAGGRPRLQVYLLWSCVLWIANGLFFYRVHQEYVGACLIAVLLPLAVLYEMSREAPRSKRLSLFALRVRSVLVAGKGSGAKWQRLVHRSLRRRRDQSFRRRDCSVPQSRSTRRRLAW